MNNWLAKLVEIVVNHAHGGHHPGAFVSRGRLVESPEKPERAARMLAALQAAGYPELPLRDFGRGPIAAVHSPDYLSFLETGYDAWQGLDGAGAEVVPNVHPGRHFVGRPDHIVGLAGYHMADTAAPLGAGTWAAAYASAQTALTVADMVHQGARAAYALCRPPGHHASADMAGGFCYLNNVAVAADYLCRLTGRVAILDLDVHHGNGTQAIFYQRPDVLFVSLHGDPAQFYPYFAGYGHERGAGAGRGYNHNFPLPPETGDDGFLAALAPALALLSGFAPEMLLISLGLDAQANDPLGILKISTQGFHRIGAAVGALALPSAIIQEGGYLCPELGANLLAFLSGFRDHHS